MNSLLNEGSNNEVLQLLLRQNDTIEKLLEKQTTTMEALQRDQLQTMKDIAKAMKKFEKNSDICYDDQPVPGQEMKNHERAWRAIFETLSAKMKEQVERWRSGTDSTLIFVALFVTVITAFQTPVSQNLSPDPTVLTNEILANLTSIIYDIAVTNGFNVPTKITQPKTFVPARSDEIVTLFWYSALLLSLSTAILSVFGRQWLEHLTTRPDGRTYQEKSIRMDLREKIANKYLKPLLDSLHPILVFSISFFIIGLLYQLWSSSLSPHKSPILILTSSIGSALIFLMVIISGYTHIHGTCWEESPFTTSTSSVIRQRLPQRLLVTLPVVKDPFLLFCTTMMQMPESHHYDHVSSVRLFDDRLLQKRTDRLRLTTDVVVHILASDASLKAKQTVAWNVREISEAHGFYKKASKVHVECCKKLWTALYSAFRNTPFNQMDVKLGFFAIGAMVLLQFSGVNVIVVYLDKRTLKEVFLKLFMLRRGEQVEQIDLDDLVWAKFEATVLFEVLLKEDVHLLDDVVDEYPDLLLAIIKDNVSIQWKRFIIPHLKEEDVTQLFKLISEESTRQDADFLCLVRVLSLVIEKRNDIGVLPEDLDFSNIIKFLAGGDGLESHGVDVLSGAEINGFLSFLTIMDDRLLYLQRGLDDFLKVMVEKVGSADSQRFFNHENISAKTSALHSRIFTGTALSIE